MPTQPFDPQLLAASAAKVAATYFVEAGRMQRAVELVKRGAVHKLANYDSIWRVSSDKAPKGYWTVNDETLICDCPDWKRFNEPTSPQYIPGVPHTCKHIASIFVLLTAQAEQTRRAALPETTIPAIMQHLFGKPLTAAKAAK